MRRREHFDLKWHSELKFPPTPLCWVRPCCCCCCQVASVVSDSVRPHRRQPTRLLHPWDFPGKSTRVGCHCLLRKDTSFSSKLQDPNNVTPAYFCSLIFLPVFPLSSNVWAESHPDLLHLLCDGIRIIVFLSHIFSGGKVCFLPTPALLVVLLEPDSFLNLAFLGALPHIHIVRWHVIDVKC